MRAFPALLAPCLLAGCTAVGRPADALQEAIARQPTIEAKAGWWKKDPGVVLQEIPLGTPLSQARAVMKGHGFECSEGAEGCLVCKAFKRTDWLCGIITIVTIHHQGGKVTDLEVVRQYDGP
jgi:hypothetical protein